MLARLDFLMPGSHNCTDTKSSDCSSPSDPSHKTRICFQNGIANDEISQAVSFNSGTESEDEGSLSSQHCLRVVASRESESQDPNVRADALLKKKRQEVELGFSKANGLDPVASNIPGFTSTNTELELPGSDFALDSNTFITYLSGMGVKSKSKNTSRAGSEQKAGSHGETCCAFLVKLPLCTQIFISIIVTLLGVLVVLLYLLYSANRRRSRFWGENL